MSRCMKGRLAIVSLATSLVLGACGDGQEETATPQLAVFAPVTFASTDGVQLSGSLFGQDGQAHESMLLLAGLAETSAQTLVLPGTGHGTDMLDGTIRQSVRDVIMDFLEEN